MEAEGDTGLEGRVHARAARLYAVAEAVSMEFGGGRLAVADPGGLAQVIRCLKEAAGASPGSYVVLVGGIAVQEWGHKRWTEDVDAVVDAEHFRAVMDHLRAHGFELTPALALRHKASKVELDLLREGVTVKGAKSPLPHPSELGPHLGVASLEGLIRLKLDAHRRQDLADIVSLMKIHFARKDAIFAALPAALREEFLELVVEARGEAE